MRISQPPLNQIAVQKTLGTTMIPTSKNCVTVWVESILFPGLCISPLQQVEMRLGSSLLFSGIANNLEPMSPCTGGSVG